MTTRLIALVAALAVAAPLAAAGPELAVDATCDTTAVPTGGTFTVPISFANGVNDGGQPNSIAAVDFVVEFAPDAFTVSEVRLPAALAGSGTWALNWERTLGLPEVPGRISVGIAPEFGNPVPTLPSGTLAEVVLQSIVSGENRCVAIDIAAGSVVFSAPPLGLAITPGQITGGGVLAAGAPESCDDCADNDLDGLIDLADPDCNAGAATFAGKRENVTVTRRRDGSQQVSVRATLPAVFEDVAGPLRVILRPESVMPPACTAVEARLEMRKSDRGKRVYLFASDGVKVAKLVSQLKPGRSTLKAKFPLAALDGAPSPLSVAIWVGTAPFHARVTVQKQTRTGHVYR